MKAVKVIAVLLFIVMIIGGLSWRIIYEYNMLLDSGSYTVATILSESNNSGIDYIQYEYSIGNRKYTDWQEPSIDKDNLKIPGGKHLLIYSRKHPEINYILFERPVQGIENLKKLPIEVELIKWIYL